MAHRTPWAGTITATVGAWQAIVPAPGWTSDSLAKLQALIDTYAIVSNASSAADRVVAHNRNR